MCFQVSQLYCSATFRKLAAITGVMVIAIDFGFTQSGIKPNLTVSSTKALSARPLINLVKSRSPTQKQSESTRLRDFPVLILSAYSKVFGKRNKAFFGEQRATMKEFCEFKSSNYQEITQACGF